MDARRLELYELATKADLLALKGDLVAMESRFEAGFAQLESRFEARFAQMEATLTRRMLSILGGWTILVGSTVGWVAVLLR